MEKQIITYNFNHKKSNNFKILQPHLTVLNDAFKK